MVDKKDIKINKNNIETLRKYPAIPDLADAPNWFKSYKSETEKVRDDLIIENIKLIKDLEQIKENLRFFRHEIKGSPLNHIIGYANLLLDDSGNLTKEQKEKLIYISESAEKATQLIEFVGPDIINNTNFNLENLVETIAISEKKFMQDNKLGLNFRYIPEEIYTSKHNVAGILNTILSNSFLWTPEYGRIEMGIREDKGNNLEILTENKVAEEKKDGKGEGKGIGQNMSKKLIKTLGGEFHLYSKPEIIYNANKNRYPVMKKYGSEKATETIKENDKIYGVKIKIPIKNLIE